MKIIWNSYICLNKVLLKHNPTCWCTIYDCFCVTVAKLRSCTDTVYYLAFYRKSWLISDLRHGTKENNGLFKMKISPLGKWLFANCFKFSSLNSKPTNKNIKSLHGWCAYLLCVWPSPEEKLDENWGPTAKLDWN